MSTLSFQLIIIGLTQTVKSRSIITDNTVHQQQSLQAYTHLSPVYPTLETFQEKLLFPKQFFGPLEAQSVRRLATAWTMGERCQPGPGIFSLESLTYFLGVKSAGA